MNRTVSPAQIETLRSRVAGQRENLVQIIRAPSGHTSRRCMPTSCWNVTRLVTIGATR